MEMGAENLIAPLTDVKGPIFYDTRQVARSIETGGEPCRFCRYCK